MMEYHNTDQSFRYTYSAKQQAEIKKIRAKYVSKETNKMEQLRRLDAGVTQKGTAVSLAAGIIGALVLGVGMCCCMVWTDWFVPGIIVGIIGITIASTAYPLYDYVMKKEREKIAPVIIRLTDDLMK